MMANYLLRVNLLHDPAINVAEHIRVEAVRGGIGVHPNVKPGGVKSPVVLSGRRQGHEDVGNAVADQDSQLAQLGQSE